MLQGFLRLLVKLLLLLLFIPVVLVTLLIVPIGALVCIFSAKSSVRLGNFLCLCWWSVYDLFFRLSIRMRVPQIPKGNYIVISNHISSTDFMVINAINRHHFSDSKYVIKKSVCYIPLFYQVILLARFLVVKRNFSSDKEVIQRYLSQFDRLGLAVWLVIFCEGHRYTSKFAAESEAFCVTQGIRPFKNVLMPRYRGFDLVVRNTAGLAIDKVLDLTIYSHGRAPSLFDILFTGKTFDYEIDARLVDIESIEEPKDFLERSFRRKDDLINQWKRLGAIPGTPL